MRAFFKFLINMWLLALWIWLIIRYTSIDENIIKFFSGWNGDSDDNGNGNDVVVEQNVCLTPWWVSIPNGSSIFAYKSPYPNDEWVCEEQKRTCEEGVLKGDFEFGACDAFWWVTGWTGNTSGEWQLPPTWEACMTPRWQSIQHGNYIVSYESPSSCKFQRRTCVDGQLLWQFQYNYCLITAGASEWGEAWDISYSDARNNSNEVHSTPVFNGGQSAITQIPNDYWNQTSNGKVIIRGTASNPATLRDVPAPVKEDAWRKNDMTYYDLTQKWCTTPWGTYVDHNQYVIGYKFSKAWEWQSCTYERRNCFNGKLNGTYTFPSCTAWGKTYTYDSFQFNNQWGDKYIWPDIPTKPTNRSCRTPWGTYVRNWDYIRAYKYSSAPWTNGCEGEIRYCQNGRLDWSYANKSCTIKNPPTYRCYDWNCGNNNWNNSCALPRWWYISHGSSVTAYSNRNGQCRTERRTCNNWYLNWSYGQQYCDSYYNPWYRSCSLPRWGSIGHGSSVTAYRQDGNSCLSESRYCSDGYLNGSYSMQNCQSQQYRTCSLPRWWYISHNESIEAFQNPTGPCTKEIRTCVDGALRWSFAYGSCVPGNNTNLDTYWNRVDAWWLDTPPHSSDSCQWDAMVSFVCLEMDVVTCMDYRKIQDDGAVVGRAKYEKRNVTCVR